MLLARLRGLLGRENGEHPENRERQKEADPESQKKTTKRGFWGRHKAAMEPSSHPIILTKKEVRKEMQRLNMELQLVTRERNELRGQLFFIRKGPVHNRPNTWYEDLKMEHEEVMTDLQRLQNENTEASEKVDELANLTVFYRGLHSQVLMEHTQLKDQVAMLRQENKNRTEDWVLLKHHLEALKLICEDQEEQTSDPQTQQQQEFERLEGSLQVLRKQKEMITQEKDLAEKLQHHFEVSQMRSEKVIHALEEATAQDESLLQKELLNEEPPAEPNLREILDCDALSPYYFISYV
ncbi:disks large homolog 5-like [Peromyscus leucopus]|uniref:disks large homolog 5-like n=1 Tax=Peromyscus leucopus TaxID=10041 RepID=UPI001884BAEC|nr:disks large homolog 5-like [Peromyscus leucopus]